jgi:hypothetical protein
MIAEADLEEGNLTDFTRTMGNSPNTFTISSSAHYNGSYGSLLSIGISAAYDDTTGGEITFSSGTGQDTVSGGFFVYLPSTLNTSQTAGAYPLLDIFGLYDGSSTSDWLCLLGLKWNSSNQMYKWTLECNDGGAGLTEYSSTITTNTWHKVEWQYYGNQSSPNGGMIIYIDDVQIINQRTHATTGLYPIKTTYGYIDGDPALVWSGSSYMYFDDIIISSGIMDDWTGF